MKFITTILGFTLLYLATAILPDKCSVEHCGTNGAHAPCTQVHPFKVTTCAVWSKTREARLQCKLLNCKFMSCYFIPLLASDGNHYCTPCHIHQVGCKTGFKVNGPVDGVVSRQIEEFVEDENASEVLEEPVSRDVQETVPTDVEEAVSKDIIITPICSMKFCTKNGANAKCRFVLPQGKSVTISCLKFSFTAQSKEQCRFFCPLFCLPEDQQPIANIGRKFCTACILRQESCRTHYRTFGPVTPPGISPRPLPVPVQTCSVPFCAMSGRSATCSLEGKKLATCADYAKTEEKKKACDFACIDICVDPDEAPVDNFGKKYCSICHLRQSSCKTDFKIFLVKKTN